MRRIPLGLVFVISILALTAACSDSRSNSPTPPPAQPPAEPPAPTFDYTISGKAVKGVIAGAMISVIDGDGNPVSGATATSNADGSFGIEFSLASEAVEPVQISLEGTGATTVCDIAPVCEYDIDGEGNALTANFGESYQLPDGFSLRAAITNLSASGDSRSGTAYISPLSDLVVELALDMDNGEILTVSNLNVANERVLGFLQGTYPSIEVGQLTEISQIPLLDLTDLESAESENLTGISLAVTSLSAAVVAFVDVQNSERRSISQVLDEFRNETLINQQTDGVLVNQDTDTLIASNAIAAMGDALTNLAELIDAGTATLPAETTLSDLNTILASAEDALPEIINFHMGLGPAEATANVQSSASASSALTLIPSTGKVIINVETTGITATAAHLHQSYAGTSGSVIVPLEQDPGNSNRWQTASDVNLGEDQVAAILSGETYLNVHSAQYPAGELRGQVLPEGIQLVMASPSGEEQVPMPVSSEGFARAAVTLDTNTNIAQVHLTTDLDLTAAHLHSASAGTNGGVVVPMDLDAATTGHWFAEDVDFSELNEAFSGAGLYFNLHTTDNPAGELRAQVVPMSHQVLISALDSLQVVSETPIDSNGMGTSAVTLDMATGNFSVHVNTSGVETATAAHIHSGAAGVNGGVIFPLQQSIDDMNHWFAENQMFSAEQIIAFQNGEMYVNVHTPGYPSGEIRGQLTALPPGYDDTDGDGVIDRDDEFPDDPAESKDSDGDGVGDNSDAFPADPSEQADTDNDGVGDNADAFPENSQETNDTDGDGVGDNSDACPTDPAETLDSDGDGICDNSDPVNNSIDADGDGVNDSVDAFPNDPNESVDSDGDGVGDNSDDFPNDSSETVDSDGDGVGDNSDVFPNDASESADTDGDGVGDNADAFPNNPDETEDTDGDGVGDNTDAFPTDPAETTDTDGDGVGDNSDNCPVDSNPNQENSDGTVAGDACETQSAPAFSEIQDIFNSRCISCHGTSGGMSLRAPNSYNNIVNVPSSEMPTLDRIEPGDPDASYLIWKIEGRSGISGSRMPLGGPFLSQDTIDQIRAWVDAGAPQ